MVRKWGLTLGVIVGIAAGAQSWTLAAQKTTITMVVYGSPDFYQALLDQFNKANPDIEAKLQVIPGFNAYVEKIPLLVASGQAPDLGILSPRIFSDWAPHDVLQSLEPFIKADPSFKESDYFPASLNDFRWTSGSPTIGAGPLYAVPIDYQSQSMFIYNVGSFHDAGLQTPDPNWTWDTMRQDAAKLVKVDASGKLIQCATNTVNAIQNWVMPFIWSAGGEIIDSSYKHMDIDQPAAKGALQWLYDFSKETNYTCGGSFLAEKQAMYSVGQYAIHYYQWNTKAKFPWDVAAYPNNPDTHKHLVPTASDAIGMFKSTKNPQAAWKLLQYLGSYDLQLWEAQKYLRPVPNMQAALRGLYSADTTGVPGGLPKHYALMANELNNAGEEHIGLNWQDIQKMLGQVWGQVLADKLSLSQGIGQMQQQGDALLKGAVTGK